MANFDDPFLKDHIASVTLYSLSGSPLNFDKTSWQAADKEMYVFQLHDMSVATEGLDEEDDLPAASHWMLPSLEFDKLWNSLIFDDHVKQNLLQYARTTLLFSDRNVDQTIISWNRVILLHGPPGTGKTSLCKALAQKLSIILSDRYRYGQLIEVNSHSLFSKWFSESGKLVMKMFKKIQEMVDEPDALVFVLIDEVESLTAARKSVSANEPSDAIRVVNALLTQLDIIKRSSNVIILATSNITGAIDTAFIDRADIKQYIGLPQEAAIYEIYYSCICELQRVKLISNSEHLMTLKTLQLVCMADVEASRNSVRLRKIAQKSVGLSGRTLRKLPFIAHSLYIKTVPSTMEQFLEALSCAVQRQFNEKHDLSLSVSD